MERTTQFGFYLIPPYDLAKELLTMRNLAYDQYRVAAAQNFMIHMTVIGFFKLAESTTCDTLISTLDEQLARFSTFRIFPAGARTLENGLGLVFTRERNAELYRLQSACFNAVKRYIARDVRMPRTSGADEQFLAHMTVCMLDASAQTLRDVEDYFRDAEFAQDGYNARLLKLYEFSSDLWDASDTWIYNMQWRPLHTWKLKAGTQAAD